MPRPSGARVWLAAGLLLVLALVATAAIVWRDDILQALLDPKVPFAVYRPPPAPDYARPAAWALAPTEPPRGPVDVFFVHPTTFDGGRDWSGPIGDRRSQAILTRVMLPNYAAPFASLGPLFAPRYRQASLYTTLTVFDDAIQAREFAYGDVRAAFLYYLQHWNAGRPFVLVGVEQGGQLAARLLSEEIGAQPALRRRLVAAYLIDTVVPADAHAPGAAVPACARPDQTGCVVAWIAVQRGDFVRALRILARAVVWNDRGRLVPLAGRAALCVNPLLGRTGDDDAPPRLNLGAVNASGLEWGVRPAFMARQVGAQCVGGVLRVTPPRSASLRRSGGFSERLRAPAFNLFWADLEADAARRSARFVQR